MVKKIADKTEKKKSNVEITKEKKTSQKKIKDLSFSELKALKEMLGDISVANRHPQGDQILIIDCGRLVTEINKEIIKRLHILL